MLLKSTIQDVYLKQQVLLMPNSAWVKRHYLSAINLQSTHIEVITGIRRCGKSTLLKQIVAGLNSEIAYLNFEDPKIFGFDINDFEKLDEVIGDKINYYYFDEIQNVANWELYIRQLHDKGKKVFITGSNASLLSKELGTRLTGRHLAHELFPFSYTEFLAFYNYQPDFDTFTEYLTLGGFPEFLATKNVEILQNLLKDVVLRDIAIRHGIRNTDVLMQLTLFLLSNVAKEHTFNKLKNRLGVGSANTIVDFTNWLSDAYLLFFLPKFSYSPAITLKNPKKVYAVDTGFIRANSLSFSSDDGRILENAVYLFLRNSYDKIYYFKENNECDFVVFKQNKCVAAVQVCKEVTNDNKTREINGLLEAMNHFKLIQGTIVTLNQSDQWKDDNKVIYFIPAYQYFSQPKV